MLAGIPCKTGVALGTVLFRASFLPLGFLDPRNYRKVWRKPGWWGCLVLCFGDTRLSYELRDS